MTSAIENPAEGLFRDKITEKNESTITSVNRAGGTSETATYLETEDLDLHFDLSGNCGHSGSFCRRRSRTLQTSLAMGLLGNLGRIGLFGGLLKYIHFCSFILTFVLRRPKVSF